MNQTEAEKTINMKGLLSEAAVVLLEYRWWFIYCLSLTTTLIVAGSLFVPYCFRIKQALPHEVTATLECRVHPALQIIFGHEASKMLREFFHSLPNDLANNAAIDKLIDQLFERSLGPDTKIDPDNLRAQIAQHLTIRDDEGTPDLRCFQISFMTNDAVLGQHVVSMLLENYIGQASPDFDRRLHEAAAYFNNGSATSQARFEELEQRHIAFTTTNGHLLSYHYRSNIKTSRNQLLSERTKLTAQREGTIARLSSVKQRLKVTPEKTVSKFSNLDPQSTKPSQRETSLDAANQNRSTMIWRHLVVDTDSSHRGKPTHSTSNQDVNQTLIDNPIYAALTKDVDQTITQLIHLQDRLDKVQSSIKTFDADIKTADRLHNEYKQLTSSVEVAHDQTESLRQYLAAARTVLTGQTDYRPVVISHDTPRLWPNQTGQPDFELTSLIIDAMFFVFATCCIGIIIYHYGFSKRCCRSEELSEAFNIPLLGTLSEVLSQEQKRARARIQMIIYPLRSVALTILVLSFSTWFYHQIERVGTRSFEHATFQQFYYPSDTHTTSELIDSSHIGGD